VLPGDGHLDLPAIVQALREAGYQGMVQPEHLGRPSEDGEDLLAEAVRRALELLAAE
jgi:sugar phosphate isomerase/epimerase